MNYDGMDYIFYDEKLAFSEKTCIIAHEIGHIVLQHTLNNSNVYGKGIDKLNENSQEKEADAFALAFLAPSPVLLEMGVFSSEAISRVAKIPMELAHILAFGIVKEKSIEKTGIEQRLIETFKDTIDLYKSSKKLFEKGSESSTSDEKSEKTVNIISTRPQDQIDIHKTVDQNEKKKNKKLMIKVGGLVVCCFAITLSTMYVSMQKIKGDSIVELNNNTFAHSTVPQIENSISTLIPQDVDKADIIAIAETNTQTVEVVTTKSGTKYHLTTCHYVKEKSDLKIMTIEEAEKKEFLPCKSCHPDDRISN